jgi:hypothetical protein
MAGCVGAAIMWLAAVNEFEGNVTVVGGREAGSCQMWLDAV